MTKALFAAALPFALALPLAAQETAKPAALAPSEIVADTPALLKGLLWVAIPAEDLLVMTLAPDAEGKPRQVVIQLMPAPFSQGWIHNIRLFARAKWYDGISVNRVHDNYVTQWGDPNYDNPEATGKPKPLPEGLKVMGEADYLAPAKCEYVSSAGENNFQRYCDIGFGSPLRILDPYVAQGEAGFSEGWQMAGKIKGEHGEVWPLHCYGMVGVGRNYSPDTGSGAELYTVIGHAPRHLDRNIALVGRVIEGMEHLSSLPRGKGALGFYTAEEAAKRTPILSVRVASDLPAAEQPRFEYLSTESATFARYAKAIANRRDPFFITPAGGADICNIKVPVRRVAAGG
jgi:peptidylprolyl isomerase